MNLLKKMGLLFVLVIIPYFTYSAKNCECGKQSTGVTSYTVSGGGCCSGLTTGYAFGTSNY